MREFRHPEIDHTFIIKDINEIEIDGVRLHKRDCDWLVMMATAGEISATLKSLSLPLLQHILNTNDIYLKQ